MVQLQVYKSVIPWKNKDQGMLYRNSKGDFDRILSCSPKRSCARSSAQSLFRIYYPVVKSTDNVNTNPSGCLAAVWLMGKNLTVYISMCMVSVVKVICIISHVICITSYVIRLLPLYHIQYSYYKIGCLAHNFPPAFEHLSDSSQHDCTWHVKTYMTNIWDHTQERMKQIQTVAEWPYIHWVFLLVDDNYMTPAETVWR